MYVLKNVGLGAGTIPHYLENFYDEVVTVKNDIALVKNEHVRNSMLTMNYVELGTVEDEGELKKLFEAKDTTVNVRKEEPKVVPLNQIFKEDEPEGAQKSWYENLA